MDRTSGAGDTERPFVHRHSDQLFQSNRLITFPKELFQPLARSVGCHKREGCEVSAMRVSEISNAPDSEVDNRLKR